MYNLQKLLSRHIIEIPVIQRDYAQGRKSAKVDRIRKGFVEALLRAVENPAINGLHLDFIYGKIESQSTYNVQENNYNHVESILAFADAYASQVKVDLLGAIPGVDREVLKTSKPKMMPLDGQQRVTTLWLLHYVLYNQSSLPFPKWMRDFSYKTRESSTLFISRLVENTDLSSTSAYSNVIKKSKWFYKAWLQDPTVKGMLVTLDEIQVQVEERLRPIAKEDRSQKLEKWIAHLVSDNDDSAIQFSFLPLSEIDVDDDIYLKMNDRGKQLSDFEIFKNDILAYLDHQINLDIPASLTNVEYEEIAKNIDNRWHDAFWNEKGADSFNVEFTFHYFFLYYLLLHRIINRKTDGLISSDYFSALIGDKRITNFERFDFKELEKQNLISLESLRYVFKNLELLSNDQFLVIKQEVVDEISFKKDDAPEFGRSFIKHFLRKDSGNIGYYDRTFNYAITSYLDRFKRDLDDGLFKEWCRILRNLIYNQAYIQGKDEFETAIKHVSILLDNGPCIENTLLDKGGDLGVFPRQLSEEVKKVSLYKTDLSLYELFASLENHQYFHGQIGFAIKMASSGKNQEAEFDKVKFMEFSTKLSSLFEPEFTKKSKWLLQRALMTKGFEFKPRSNNRREIFSNNSSDLRLKEEGWRWLFKNEAASEYFGLFVSLLEGLDADDLENDLHSHVNEYNVKDWKYYFVKEPSTIRACQNRMVKKQNDDEVRLLKNPTANGYNSELRTKYFERNLNINLSPFEEVKYHTVPNQQERPCCYLTGWGRNASYHLDIRYIKGNYELKFLNTDNSNQNNIDFAVLTVLKELGFEDDNENGFVLYIRKKENQDTDDTMTLKLEEVLSVLKTTDASTS